MYILQKVDSTLGENGVIAVMKLKHLKTVITSHQELPFEYKAHGK